MNPEPEKGRRRQAGASPVITAPNCPYASRCAVTATSPERRRSVPNEAATVVATPWRVEARARPSRRPARSRGARRTAPRPVLVAPCHSPEPSGCSKSCTGSPGALRRPLEPHLHQAGAAFAGNCYRLPTSTGSSRRRDDGTGGAHCRVALVTAGGHANPARQCVRPGPCPRCRSRTHIRRWISRSPVSRGRLYRRFRRIPEPAVGDTQLQGRGGAVRGRTEGSSSRCGPILAPSLRGTRGDNRLSP